MYASATLVYRFGAPTRRLHLHFSEIFEIPLNFQLKDSKDVRFVYKLSKKFLILFRTRRRSAATPKI